MASEKKKSAAQVSSEKKGRNMKAEIVELTSALAGANRRNAWLISDLHARDIKEKTWLMLRHIKTHYNRWGVPLFK